ncbi:hypothetical protein Gbth_075_012 [Gluconobacter thailandicus F149-1 = NBRC 100600]|jgi:hypothetical protein|uniref:Bacteriophage T5 Orf172 DNA-binding domain-containing protein n=2 Tax=Acetobacteraceae TaxID=433 RepID=A0A6S6PVI7_ACEAC|nr:MULTISPECIES: GIY-YIG nuclease family protein [Acetobacteraceae]TCS26535.1 T5orf172 domain-containing protein [Acetobacter aceti NBRC 14818]BAK85237.1 hypothetical protein GLX_30760 [Komagataeibacter medellinensis NBRC 3288]BCI69014.1 hypothetical protein AAJCM20276_36380 [Acetobacter aceti]GAN94599.1 hypothetical protein Gbth_075_012 [Gluconobacter thailandicus F149-1 = NBRC 100600]GEL88493.1 hypothetical protein GTH01_28510 [Gluconobacter thailandicus F149-1 = NBRC 100600]
MPEAGWLYVLEIPALPGVVKIGRTSRDPTLRCRGVGGADCPFELVVAWKKPVPDAQAAEKQAHRMLVAKRLRRADRVLGHVAFARSREFYRANVQDVTSVLEVIVASRVRARSLLLAAARPGRCQPFRSGWKGRRKLARHYRPTGRAAGFNALMVPMMLLAVIMAVRPDVNWLPWPIAASLEWLESLSMMLW